MQAYVCHGLQDTKVIYADYLSAYLIHTGN